MISYLKTYGFTGALAEIFLFYYISTKIKKNYHIKFDNNICYYWICFTILTGIWEFFYILNYSFVRNMSKNLIKNKQHVWFNKYSPTMILPWNLSHIFYSEYAAYADREYMTNKDIWSRIIEGTHSTLCGIFSFLTIYYYHIRESDKFRICLGISMGSQLMNSILYCGQYLIQTKTKNSINFNSKKFPCGKYFLKRPFMLINIFWLIMPTYILFYNLI